MSAHNRTKAFLKLLFKRDFLVLGALLNAKQSTKGQLTSKADWCTIDSPKKRMDEFVLFAFLLFTANKSHSFVRFFGRMRANLLFGFIWPLVSVKSTVKIFFSIFVAFLENTNFNNVSFCSSYYVRIMLHGLLWPYFNVTFFCLLISNIFSCFFFMILFWIILVWRFYAI